MAEPSIDHVLSLTLATGDVLGVRRFRVREGLHEDFHIELEAVVDDCDIDFDRIIGRPARFALARTAVEGTRSRAWSGLCAKVELVGLEDDHLSTYRLELVPTLWLLHKRRNYRVFQHLSDPRIAQSLLAASGIDTVFEVDDGDHPGRKYRVQYAESDHAFVSRLLEDAGVTFLFEERDGNTSLVLSDGPQLRRRRASPVRFEHNKRGGELRECAFDVNVQRQIRPGRYTQADVDYRRHPEFPLQASAKVEHPVEAGLERYHLNYGSFLFSADADGSTPVADGARAARTDLGRGAAQVERRLDAQRTDARACTFETTAHDLAPGITFSFSGHPRGELGDDVPLLVVASELSGKATGDWMHRVQACFCERVFRPPLETRKPQTRGVESATVVGPDDEDIHTDEFGRVRVQFHWDRDGKRDDQTSCWIPVSQPWGGASFGAVNIPRIDQEVLVDFLGGDPDRPVVVGRVFTKTQPVPYPLPEYKTVSGIRSRTANKMVMGAADGPPGSPVAAVEAVMPTPAPTTFTVKNGRTPAMTPDRLEAALEEPLFRAVSPNGETHRWSGNEITFQDQSGGEVLYMQAQRNMHQMVREDALTVIGGARGTKIGGDDTLTVVGGQTINVKQDRVMKVEGFQSRIVTEDIVQVSETGNQAFLAEKMFTTWARDQDHYGDESIVMRVGSSSLIMRKEFVVIQSPHLFLNPGDDAAQLAMEGVRPETPEEKQERLAREKAARDLAAIQPALSAFDADMAERPRPLVLTGADVGKEMIRLREEGLIDPGMSDSTLYDAGDHWVENLSRDEYRTILDGWNENSGRGLSGADLDKAVDPLFEGRKP